MIATQDSHAAAPAQPRPPLWKTPAPARPPFPIAHPFPSHFPYQARPAWPEPPRRPLIHGGTVSPFPRRDIRQAAAGNGSGPLPPRVPTQGNGTETTAGLRVLVVDDNVDSADSMALLLSLDGYEVRVAFDGSSALAEATRFLPRAVLLDIGLPGMDGYEVARRLRGLPGLRDALMIAITGYGQDDDRARSRAAGFDHHLVKPVDPETLGQLLGALQSRR